ncbi:hypothetical protein [Marinilabilia rubra]|uniref:Uncharacterized protein n=1 Tax=Marinilabilia rubra TaxID=2162893 RepID=A0A2U2B4F9_9BACT|nr:hypothetical protein [Marinilabilia rubra]PWD97924.1 hypothetical protein DDZ16_18385 [Marinilabilia rubra]
MNLQLRLYFKRGIKIFLRTLLVLLITGMAYFFYQPGVRIFNTNVDNPFYARVANLEPWLYLVVCLIVFFLFLFLFLFFLSYYFDLKRKREAKLVLIHENFFSERLSEYLLCAKYENLEERKAFVRTIAPFTRKTFQIEVLFNTYTFIQETLAINLSHKFIILLKDLRLYNRQKSFLYSSRIYKRIIGMKMLSYLRIADFNKRILYYTHSPNYALRTEAFAALVRLMDNTDQRLSFIGEHHSLSLLEINVVVNAVLKNFKTDIDYKSLLTATQVCKKIVGAQLIKHRKLNEYSHLLFEGQNIGTRNLLLRQSVWDSFLELSEESEFVDVILERFDAEAEEVKILILEKLSEAENPRFLEFLGDIVERQPLLVKVEALKTLFNSDIVRFITFKGSTDIELKKAFNEVSDININ